MQKFLDENGFSRAWSNIKEYIGSELGALPAGGSPSNGAGRSVTLLQSEWSDGVQTVSVPGVLADETKQLIQPTPTTTSQSDYYKSGILCTAQAAGELTFTALREPEADIDLIVVITSLVGSSSSTEPEEPEVPEPAYRIIGVMWDSSDDSTALTRLTPETDPNHYVNTTIKTEPVAAVGTGNGSSPFDKYYPWSDMEQYNIGTSSVLYKRGDSEFSQTEYDTMVYIPKFYYNVINDGTKWYWYVSTNQLFDFEKHPGSERYVGRYEGSQRTFYPSTELSLNSDIIPYAPGQSTTYTSRSGTTPAVSMTRATARTYSHNRGDNWWLFDIATLSAIQLLYLVEFADWNSQAKIGRGIVDDTSAHVSGETDSMVYHTGLAEGEDGKTAVQYRWIENPLGNVFSWVDGLYVSNLSYSIAINANSSSTSTDISMTTTNGYISNIKYSSEFPWSFIPSAKDGSNNIKIPDAAFGSQTLSAVTPYLPSYNRDSVSGGCFGLGDNAGMFCYWFPDQSSSDVHVGSRLIYIP